ncbi:MAG: YfhO family protein, partial [Chloroflexi bacterium]|nr:YfhO family protein [Chloroflexota bacterium]
DVGYDFTSGGFGLREGLGLLLPNAMGGRTLYLGIIPLLLAAGALLWPMSRKVALFAALALIAFLVSFGRELPLYRILYVAAPGFNVFKDQERAAALTSFALAVLAGYGVAGILSWSREEARKRMKPLSALAGVVAVIGGVAWLLLSRSQSVLAGLSQARREALAGDLPSIEIAALVAVAVFLLAAWRRLDVRAGLVLAGGVAVAQLFVINWNSAIAPGKPPVFYPKSPLMDFLRDKLTTGRVELGSLAANSGYVYRLPVARGATPLETRYLADVVRTRSPRLWQLLDAEYAVADAASPYASPVFEWQGQGVFKTPYPTARAYVAFRAMRFGDDKQILDILSTTDSDFLYGRDALLVDEPGVEPTGKGYVSSIEVQEEGPRSLAVRVNANSPGILVVSDVYYPGWKAYVDGAEKPILRANYFLRGVALGPGPHVVRMVFAPASVKIGALISIIALGMVLALLVACMSIRQLHKRLGYALLLGLALLSLWLSWRALTPRQPSIRRQDLRAASAYLLDHVRPDDALVLDSSISARDLSAQPAGAPIAVVSPTPQPQAARIWRLTSLARPRAEASEDAWRPPLLQIREERWFGDLYLALHEDTEAVKEGIGQRLQRRLGDSIQLLGYNMALERAGAEGSRLQIALYWTALQEPDDAYAVFVQLLGPDGRLAFQDDSQPVMNTRPTTGWQKGEIIADKHVLRLPASAAAGRYSLITGMYSLTGERRLPVEGGGDFVPLQEIELP